MKKKTLNKKLLIALGVFLAIIIVIFVYQNYKPEIDLLIHPVPHEKEILLHMIRAHGIANSLLLLGLIAILNSIPGLSNSVICILSGLCYGPFFGFIINWMGNVLGNCIVMSLIRKIKFSKKVKQHKLIKSLMHQKHPLIGLTIGFMIPGYSQHSCQLRWCSVKRQPATIHGNGYGRNGANIIPLCLWWGCDLPWQSQTNH